MYRRRKTFWLAVAVVTAFITIEPALFLVVLALGLSAVALFWIALVARHLVVEVIGKRRQVPNPPHF